MARRELDKLRLFKDLGYEPHPGQLLVHKSRALRRVLACGVRWGKSMVGVMECVAALLEPREETRGWIVAPALAVAERMLVEVRAIFDEHIPHRLSESKGRHQLTVTNLGGGTSTVWAKSTDNPAALLGEGLDFLIIDEACKVKDEVWYEALVQRLTDRKGWALALSTPGLGWFFRSYARGQSSRDPDYESWSGPTWDNPRVDRNAVEAERARMPDDKFRELYGGEFVGPEANECGACGPAVPENSGYLIINNGDQVPKCPDCDEPVDEHGRTLATRWPNGQRHMRMVIIYPETIRSAPLPVPGVSEEPGPSLN